MTAKTATERKREQRIRYKQAGLVEVTIWLLPEQVDAVKKKQQKALKECLT